MASHPPGASVLTVQPRPWPAQASRGLDGPLPQESPASSARGGSRADLERSGSADKPDRAGLRSLRALTRGVFGLLLASSAMMLATGNPLALQLAPMVLAAAAIACGIGVFLLNPAPKARWRGMGASAIVTGCMAVLVQVGVLP